MKLSRECEYGLRGLLYLAQQPVEAVCQAAEVARAAEVPQPFLSKILLKLVRHGLVRSHRGRLRGDQLGRPAAEISLKGVVEAIEGEGFFRRCALWQVACPEADPCVLHAAWQAARAQFAAELAGTSLAELAPRR